MKSAIRYAFLTMIPSCRPKARGTHGRLALLWAALSLLTLPAAAQSIYATAYTFTTFVGEAAVGSADGVGAAAQFDNPSGVAVDGEGNLYVADFYNHTIREITPAAEVITIAGFPGLSGAADGTNSAARFNGPQGIALDSAGSLYVADYYNNTIRTLTRLGTNWVVTTIAGSAGNYGSANGTGTNALFSNPYGIAVDGATNLYVADLANDTVRKVAPNGNNWIVSTIAGLAGDSGTNDGPGGSARFFQPFGVAVDEAANVYVTDAFNHTLRRIRPIGTNWTVSTIAGSPGNPGSADGTNSAAGFQDRGGSRWTMPAISGFPTAVTRPFENSRRLALTGS